MSATLVNGVYAEHGRYTTYGNKGCRCAECREAHRLHWSEWAHRTGRHVPRYVHDARVAVAAEVRDNHGTESRYRFGCRCAECREAVRVGRARRRARAAA